ncbi:hypothetical protein FGG08_002209 [Glutinoglossum americanum]|uniref:U-box domain-containing protein n=1 Tax=Glutinoglossum americanum TaxID=1670608 RepID=A0A9P8KZD6_9PEZI|nr:hypothetical protein FGG08_002209 [Glutinoglossum americanum]
MENPALMFKEKGNRRFEEGDYKGAEKCYTEAIVRDPKNHIFFTNRAFARIKLSSWGDVIDDCIKSIELSPQNMKAFYYLAQAQLELNRPNEALASARKAYDICVDTGSTSMSYISALVLRIKKELWEHRERSRIRDQDELLAELTDRLERARDMQEAAVSGDLDRGEKSTSEAEEDIRIIHDISQRKIDELHRVFALAHPNNLKKRTKTGQSYDRSSIMEHIRRSKTDPLTREPLLESELRPNLALKQACAAFLEENGWAVDW